jgi:GT2 family glycosyltransferase
MTPSVSVVIVNYNAGELLARCLESLGEHLDGYAWNAVVIDNQSTDGSDRLAERFAPRVSLLRQSSNTGFGRAINAGVAATAGDPVLFLNPDGRLLRGAVEGMWAELEAHPDCAVAGPGVLNDDGSRQGSARGDPDMLTGLFGRSTWLTRWFPRAAFARRNVVTGPESGTGQTSLEVDWVSGSCMLVRRDAFNRVGGFDERYFLYWEDADLCRRLRSAGYRVRYCPDAHVVHTVGRSSRTAQALAIRAFHRSAYLYYVSHVESSPWSPARWAAFVLLRARCWWKLAVSVVAGRKCE